MKTLKAVVAKYNQTSLILRILIGLAAGSVLALVAPGAGWVGELGSLFVGALKGIAPVLVFVIVASAQMFRTIISSMESKTLYAGFCVTLYPFQAKRACLI